MEFLTPGGFERFFDEYEEIAAKLASGEISGDEHRRARAELSAISRSPLLQLVAYTDSC